MSGGGKKKQTIGYKYFMGLHGGLCHGPVDEVVELRAGGATLWSGSRTASGTISVNAPNAFGGEKKEGGVAGSLDIMMGESTQTANSYLSSVISGLMPAFRGLLTFVFRRGYIGANNPYPKPWSFRVRRATKGWQGDAPWYSAKAQITLSNGAKAMNPAHIVYEVLTNSDWGMGYPTTIIDNAAFTAAADQLYTEGFGLCLFWSRTDTIENFLQMVMDHAGAVLVQSRTTGLFQFNLIRGGYTIGTLPVITGDNIIDVDSIEAATITGGTNEITTTYVDPTTKAKGFVTLQALGAVQAQGVIVSADREYRGLASNDLAQRITARDLRAQATPLKRVKLKLDRTAYNFLPGGLFVLNFPDFNFASVVFRIGEIDYGTLLQGYISVTAIQDVFSLPDQTYFNPQDSGWVEPDTDASVAPNSARMESTYRDLAQVLSDADLSALPTTAGYVGLMAQRPSGLAVNYQIWTRVGAANYEQHGEGDFTPTGTLQASIAPFDTAITINGGVDLDLVTVPCAAIIENEIVSITAINPTTGAATIGRGCVDTVPVLHTAGARIWIYEDYLGSDTVQYFSGESVNAKQLTVTTKDVLDISLAPTLTTTIVGRQAKPYPPALLSVNGTRWDQVVKITGPLSLTWRERNRLTQNDQLLDQNASTVTPEVGTTYTITLKDGGGTTFYTATGVTGTSWTWPTPDDTHTTIQLTVAAVRAGILSFQSQTLPATPRIGYGMNYGTNYGSV